MKRTRRLFLDDMRGYTDCIKLIEPLIRLHVPKVMRHLNKLEISMDQLGGIVGGWFITLFSMDQSSLAFCTRIWDSFLLDGFETIIRVGVAIFQLSQHQLLACPSTETVVAHLKQPLEQVVDPEPVLSVAWRLRIDAKTLRKIRLI